MTAALALNTDLPTPKYRIGQSVFHASETSVRERMACPDCLGTKLWKVTTPSGGELETECMRCNGQLKRNNIPSLDVTTWKPVVTRLTIGSVRIDTNESPEHGWHREPVSYMCRETGVGSGTIYYESQIFQTEDEAQKAAEAKAAARTAEDRARPQRVEQIRVSYLNLKDAALEQFRSGLWNSWYRYRNLRKTIVEFLEDENKAASELRDDIQSELDYDTKYRTENHPLDALIAAASKVDDADVKKALAAIPFAPALAVIGR